MQGLTFGDLQSLLNASEGRQTAALNALRDSLSDMSEKLDKALERSARDDVRIHNLTERVDELETNAPDNNATTRIAKYIGSAIVAAVVGAAVSHADKLFLPPHKQLGSAEQPPAITATK